MRFGEREILYAESSRRLPDPERAAFPRSPPLSAAPTQTSSTTTSYFTSRHPSRYTTLCSSPRQPIHTMISLVSRIDAISFLLTFTPFIPSATKEKATDETLTSENWETILNLCDKVQDEGEQGSVSRHLCSPICAHTFARARNVIAAILKRLAHRNPNVQLYSLTLTESLSKNCSKELHSEIASRAFTQALERLITDRVRTLAISSFLQCL